jgi:NADH dehydrogenase
VATRTRAGCAGSEHGRRTVGYDILVYALGSTVDTGAVPGAAEHAHTLATATTAELLSDTLAALPAGATFAVCGGGLCGIELATEVAESHPRLRVKLISRTEPGVWLSQRARAHLRRVSGQLRVDVEVGAEIVDVGGDALSLRGGVRVPYDAVAWAGGSTVPEQAREAGLAVDADGRVLVDGTLRSVSHPEVYAIGDAAAAPGPWGRALAYGCRSGGFTGPYVADAIACRLAGRSRNRSASATSMSASASVAGTRSCSS